MTSKITAARVAKPATHLDVLTVADGRVGVYGYARGIIITGVPAGLVELHAGWMNTDADAVKAARAAGADMVSFRA